VCLERENSWRNPIKRNFERESEVMKPAYHNIVLGHTGPTALKPLCQNEFDTLSRFFIGNMIDEKEKIFFIGLHLKLVVFKCNNIFLILSVCSSFF
jgi:hypothetical protein